MDGAKTFLVTGGEVEPRPFVQDNHSWSNPAYTLHGVHFQTAPRAQGKLICVARGRALDVAVDIQRSSLSDKDRRRPRLAAHPRLFD
jgi:dTDP-4-dehydrorhamnose 3,5-epimerase-like enzyme